MSKGQLLEGHCTYIYIHIHMYVFSTNRLSSWPAREVNRIRQLVLFVFTWALCFLSALICCIYPCCVHMHVRYWEYLFSFGTVWTWGHGAAADLTIPNIGQLHSHFLGHLALSPSVFRGLWECLLKWALHDSYAEGCLISLSALAKLCGSHKVLQGRTTSEMHKTFILETWETLKCQCSLGASRANRKWIR